MHKIGDRVYAIYGADKEKQILKVLGPGTYQGDEVPETAVGWMADAAVKSGLRNPKILLDNGDVVWGCECWWGEHDPGVLNVQHYKAAGWTIEEIRIEDERKKYREPSPDAAEHVEA